jgi:CRP-like cAMP-binding protein
MQANPLFAKFDRKLRLRTEEKSALSAMLRNRMHRLPGRRDLYIEGDPVSPVRMILEGWACRYDQLANGRRQILELLLPGDLLGLDRYFAQWHNHSACSISAITYALVPRGEIERVVGQHPRLGRAFLWDSSITSATHREWIRSLGGMNATQRIAHLFCELYYRSVGAALARGMTFSMPMGQRDLADATGLSTVQVNRTVKVLRSAGLLSWQRREIEILNLPGLARIGLFKPDYLDLDRTAESELERWEVPGRDTVPYHHMDLGLPPAR